METQFKVNTPVRLGSDIEFEPGRVTRLDFVKNDSGSVSILAFDAGVGIEPHAVPYDVMVQVVEGAFEFNVDGTLQYLKKHDVMIMPAMTVHSVKAAMEPSKLLLSRFKAE